MHTKLMTLKRMLMHTQAEGRGLKYCTAACGCLTGTSISEIGTLLTVSAHTGMRCKLHTIQHPEPWVQGTVQSTQNSELVQLMRGDCL